MSPDDLATIERALGECSCSSEEAESATEALVQLRRRDWAVRVLDADSDREIGERYEPARMSGTYAAFMSGELGRRVTHVITFGARELFADGADAARLAAALAVFPTLSADARAELGECP